MKTIKLVSAVLLFGAAGCYTLSETEYPSVSVQPVPSGKSVSLRLEGFQTGVYNYEPIVGHETMVPGQPDADTLAVQNANIDIGIRWDLERSASGRMVIRALNELKRKGYTVSEHGHQDYVVRVFFSGPEYPSCMVARTLGYGICTLFTAEKNELTWRATVEVLDAKGKTVFTKDYEQNYCTTVWGPIPIGSPACHPMSTDRGANSWAITALTDCALADATSFIVGQLK